MTQPNTPAPAGVLRPVGTSMAGGGFAALVGALVAGAIVANNPELAPGQEYIAGTVAGVVMGIGTFGRRLLERMGSNG